MTYQELKDQMPDATFMYADVTLEEVETITQSYWRIPMGSVFAVGTQEPEGSLIGKAVPDDRVP